jgi:hypothetical protein
MKKLLLGLAVLAATLSVSSRASADELIDTNGAEGLLTLFGFGMLDIGMTAIDISFATETKWAPRPYGGVETLVGGLQFVVCLDNALSPRPGGLKPAPWELGAAFGALFLAHGIVTLAKPWSSGEAPPPPAPVTVAPLALSDVARGSVPGLAVVGRF